MPTTTSKANCKVDFSIDMPNHPARFSSELIPIFCDLLQQYAPLANTVFDPFGGTGERLDELASLLPQMQFRATEIEPLWHVSERVCLGNALRLPLFDDSVDVVLTSPAYGNRMADHHNAKDGSRRRTYRHMLGVPLHPDNSGAMQWGEAYRAFHVAAWTEAKRILQPYAPRYRGILMLNIKNHIRGDLEMKVTQWHTAALVELGFDLIDIKEVPVPSMRFGANANKRALCESVIVFANKF